MGTAVVRGGFTSIIRGEVSEAWAQDAPSALVRTGVRQMNLWERRIETGLRARTGVPRRGRAAALLPGDRGLSEEGRRRRRSGALSPSAARRCWNGARRSRSPMPRGRCPSPRIGTRPTLRPASSAACSSSARPATRPRPAALLRAPSGRRRRQAQPDVPGLFRRVGVQPHPMCRVRRGGPAEAAGLHRRPVRRGSASRPAIPAARILKSIDLTKNGLAVPEVDEIAAVALDAWAAEQGYTKLCPNLFGL